MKKDIKDKKEEILIKMTKEQLRLSIGKFLINSGIKNKDEVLSNLLNMYIDEQGSNRTEPHSSV